MNNTKVHKIRKCILYIQLLFCLKKNNLNTYALFHHLPLKPSQSSLDHTPKQSENLPPPESPKDKDDHVSVILTGLLLSTSTDSDEIFFSFPKTHHVQ